jgi:putative colanic acid biosynthesis acetyltransferase WcaF
LVKMFGLITSQKFQSAATSVFPKGLCGNHDFKKSTFDLITRPIDLEDGVWIGAKCVVAPGVTCRSHSVLSLGSVATKDLEAWTVYQGNPATAKKPRSQNS